MRPKKTDLEQGSLLYKIVDVGQVTDPHATI